MDLSSKSINQSNWQFWVDRGGTFTDLVARNPEGHIVTHKLLSENPGQYKDAAVQGIRNLLQLEKNQKIPAEIIDSVKMGTTVATNALLERKGEKTLLVTTKGFEDSLRIGYQTRPRLFDLQIKLPEMLYDQVIGIHERVGARGQIQIPLNIDDAELQLQSAFSKGIRVCAIVLMHGYRFTDHEEKLAELAHKIGFTQISTSHQTSPLMKLVSRGDTTVVDAYLSPILRQYVDQVAEELGETRLMFMQSNGGLTDAHFFQGKDAILSGPAGGVVGMSGTSHLAGFNKVIGFDMGGTSTDVSHYSGEYERTFETEVAGVRIRAPMMLINTVAAGGGSILDFDGARYRVGPSSAGATPGPACYDNGGPLTVTDCNVMLGKLDPDHFPKIFGPTADQPINSQIVRKKFKELTKEVIGSTGQDLSPEQVAEGFLFIAVENMANAIKKISVQRGYDVSEYALSCFGGAGGQHACMVADSLGMKKIHIHPYAGVLSAYGMGLADQRILKELSFEKVLTETALTEVVARLTSLEEKATQEMLEQKLPKDRINVQRTLHIKYDGSDTSLVVMEADLAKITQSFEAAHQQRFGFISPEKPLVIEAMAVEIIGEADGIETTKLDSSGETPGSPKPFAEKQIYFNGIATSCGFFSRNELNPAQTITGPAIIVEDTGTIAIEPGWRAEISPIGDLILSRYIPLERTKAIGTNVDPVMLEIFNNLFMNVAEQMGTVLEKTAYSVNIKERLDFSCAIFDLRGDLIANAPHMPVHLGSMSESIKSVITKHEKSMKAGDVFVLNAPYNGGTHLPDVTVITPVFDDNNQDVLFYVASRGHHADIGGLTPGSMPPDSKHVEEEGVLLDNILLVDGGEFLEGEIIQRLKSGPYPSRNVHQNIADLKAQIAACEKGIQELRKMVDHYSISVVHAYMQHVQDNAEESVRRVLDVLKAGSFTYPMDDGFEIAVNISIDKPTRSATIDFTGTSGQHPTNYNAPKAVTTAAVLYVFRCLVDTDIPLNAGCLKPLTIIIPDKSMLSPEYPAAVVAGNVETSQCITDCLFGALGVMAAAQGTMNNFTFGNNQYQYYETICGGSGASNNFSGTSAVHTHMTNARLTDPEVLEWRFPVTLESFEIRAQSGGRGKHVGGDGTLRKIRFDEKMTAALLSSHRVVPPFGLNGGEDGEVGAQWVRRRDGTVDKLEGRDKTLMKAGDTFIIQTPSGGGFGPKE